MAGLRKIEEEDFGEEEKTEPAEATQNKAPVARFKSLQRLSATRHLTSFGLGLAGGMGEVCFSNTTPLFW